MHAQHEDIRESWRAIGQDQRSGPFFSQPNPRGVDTFVLTRCAVKNPNDQILSLRKQIKTQDKRQEARIAEVKRIVKDALKDQIVDNMRCISLISTPSAQGLSSLIDRAQIQDQIQEEIALQVREQVVSQIRSHLPILLDEVRSQTKLKDVY